MAYQGAADHRQRPNHQRRSQQPPLNSPEPQPPGPGCWASGQRHCRPPYAPAFSDHFTGSARPPGVHRTATCRRRVRRPQRLITRVRTRCSRQRGAERHRRPAPAAPWRLERPGIVDHGVLTTLRLLASARRGLGSRLVGTGLDSRHYAAWPGSQPSATRGACQGWPATDRGPRPSRHQAVTHAWWSAARPALARDRASGGPSPQSGRQP